MKPSTQSQSGNTEDVVKSSTASEKEKTKLRERQRRAITTKIFSGLRKYGGYNLPPRADINDVLRALAAEAGWVVEADGTTYRSPTGPPPSHRHVGGNRPGNTAITTITPNAVQAYNQPQMVPMPNGMGNRDSNSSPYNPGGPAGPNQYPVNFGAVSSPFGTPGQMGENSMQMQNVVMQNNGPQMNLQPQFQQQMQGGQLGPHSMQNDPSRMMTSASLLEQAAGPPMFMSNQMVSVQHPQMSMNGGQQPQRQQQNPPHPHLLGPGNHQNQPMGPHSPMQQGPLGNLQSGGFLLPSPNQQPQMHPVPQNVVPNLVQNVPPSASNEGPMPAMSPGQSQGQQVPSVHPGGLVGVVEDGNQNMGVRSISGLQNPSSKKARKGHSPGEVGG